jgi:hypothetical protein
MRHITMNAREERIQAALGSMDHLGPRNLRKYLNLPTPDFDPISPEETDALLDLLLDPSQKSAVAALFANLMRRWDNTKGEAWAAGTPRNTAERRRRIHECLSSTPEMITRIDQLIPFFLLDEPLIIAKEHRDWYDPDIHGGYYWRTYLNYLRERKNWRPEALLNIDNATRSIVECLADPSGAEAYASRGLVMGYVQSGKTANFTGVVARAADAGYRLIIVLAGTWNILRNQTQRRIDKELIGKELLENDATYQETRPNDWDEFLEHGFNPVEQGHPRWVRITLPDYDYKRLKAAIEVLEYPRRDPAKPLFDPVNLKGLPVKLLVIKKNSTILAKLVQDFKLLATRISDLPALIIDDESDQAGINTIAPGHGGPEERERTAINARIVELLKLFPRGQYVGYTATPYANALVDPDDEVDLFPKDFIISLDRPSGYMGISDFFDPDSVYGDLDPQDFSSPEIAFIHRVESPIGGDDEDLKRAIRTYVLAGAMKLYRADVDPGGIDARHHTMMIHTSARMAHQSTVAAQIEVLWNECAFSTPQGLAALKDLWESNFRPVSAAQEPALPFPAKFVDLHAFLSDAIERITRQQQLVMVLNSDNKEAPDFSAGPVWRMIVGGNKLSRGYTIEGLTVSYYRRVTSTGDTLMQMGRWFGFRRGYRDLVRVFLGVAEGKNSSTDLVELFKSVCLMEERFRDELKRYVRQPGDRRITPRDIPPLIQVTGNIRPTARNKMFNAIIRNRNYSGRWTQPTLVAADSAGIKANNAALKDLLSRSQLFASDVTLGGLTTSGSRDRVLSHVFTSDTGSVIGFLKAFHWLRDEYPHPQCPSDIGLQLEFLANSAHGITSWLVVLPQRKDSFGDALTFGNELPDLHVKERHRIENRGFQQFGEPAHRRLAAWLCGLRPSSQQVELDKVDEPAASMRDAHRGILMIYPVREDKSDDAVAIGYEMLYPKNDLGFDINFSVRRKSDPEAVVVPID